MALVRAGSTRFLSRFHSMKPTAWCVYGHRLFIGACHWIDTKPMLDIELINLRSITLFLNRFDKIKSQSQEDTKKYELIRWNNDHTDSLKLIRIKWPGDRQYLLNNAIGTTWMQEGIKVGMRTDAQLIISISDRVWEFPRNGSHFLIVYRVDKARQPAQGDRSRLSHC